MSTPPPGARYQQLYQLAAIRAQKMQGVLSALEAEARLAASPTLSPRSVAIAMGMDERTLARIYGSSGGGGGSLGEQALGREPVQPSAGGGVRRASIAGGALQQQQPAPKPTPQRRHSLPEALVSPLHPAAAGAEAASAAFLERMRRGREQAQERAAAALHGKGSPPPRLHARSPPAAAAWLNPHRAPPGHSPAAAAAAPHTHEEERLALQAAVAAAVAAAAPHGAQRALAEAREADARMAAAAAAVRAQAAEARERAAAVAARRQAAAAAENARVLAAAAEADEARRLAAEARERAAAAAARRHVAAAAEAERKLAAVEAARRQAAEAAHRLAAAGEAEAARRHAATAAEAAAASAAAASAAAASAAAASAAEKEARDRHAWEAAAAAAEDAARQRAHAAAEQRADELRAAQEAAAAAAAERESRDRHAREAAAAMAEAAVAAAGQRAHAAAEGRAAQLRAAEEAAAAAAATAAEREARDRHAREAAGAAAEAAARQRAHAAAEVMAAELRAAQEAAAAAASEKEARDMHAREAAAAAAAETAARQRAHAAAEARAAELRAAQEAAAAAAAAERESRDRHAREAAAAAAAERDSRERHAREAEAAARQRAHAAAEQRAAEQRAAQEAAAAAAAAEKEARDRRAREAAAAAAALQGGGASAAAQPARDARTGTYPLALSGTWTRAECTGYREVDEAPQWRIVPAASGSLTLTLKGGYNSPSASLTLLPAHPRGAKFSGQPSGFGQFCNTESSATAQVSAGNAYTLILTTYSKGLAADETELGWKITGSLPLLEPPAPLTLALRAILDADALAAKAAEKARRAAALARMQAAPPGTTARESWEDFQVASARVEALRAECRAKGRPYEDGWSGSRQAIGAWEEGKQSEWARFAQLAPNPSVFENGYRLQDVEQGALGDCYFLAAVADLAGGLGAHLEGVLDTLFVTAEPNPEGVYCVRLWVAGRWQHFFMDERLPCRPDSYVTIGQPDSVFSSSAAEGPDPSHGRFIPLRSVSSHSRNAMWPCLLEKAWAMLHGSYADIEGHARSDALSPLNYFLPHSLEYTCQPVPLPSGGYSSSSGGNRDTVLSEDELWDKLTLWQAKGWPMTTGSRTTAASGAGGDHGIVRKHAFSLMRVFTTPNSLGGERLLQLRNPHGEGEWDGRYSDMDTASWTPALRAITGYNPEASGDDGVFHMCLQDFQAQFSDVNVTPSVRLARDGGGWHKAVVRGAFTSTQLRASAAQGDWLDKELQFPQLLVHAGGASSEIAVTLELDQRSRKKEGAHPMLELSCYAYRSGTGVTPIKSGDHTHSVREPATMQSLGGAASSNGCATVTKRILPGNSLVFIPFIKGLEGKDSASYTLSVLSETAFTCRVAQPGAGSSTEEGVAWLSK